MEHCNIVCLVKIIPDVEQMAYDPEKNILVREQKKSILNPEDASAVAAALGIKKKYPAQVTVVTMGPPWRKNIWKIFSAAVWTGRCSLQMTPIGEATPM